MTRLEEIEPGVRVVGLASGGRATVESVAWHGDQAITVVFSDGEGGLGRRVVFRDEEPSLELATEEELWSFDGDGELLRLVSEAMRIRLAYLFDPYLAVNTSSIDPLPHQISAVYGEMLPRQPLRFLLADDPGAGKTIMTGLYIKELIIRGEAERCLIVAPGNLVEQWREELYSRFGLSFTILSREDTSGARLSNPFEDHPLMIARMDVLSRNQELADRLAGAPPYDLVVVDEAHKMSATYVGEKVDYTRRYHLGETLSQRASNFLLLTATPHSGNQENFELFMSLLDADRFEGRARDSSQTDASDMMRRLLKEELYTFESRPLFPERYSYTVGYELTQEEDELYREVTDYVREEFSRAERFAAEGEEERRLNVGFALQILQRRLASSPEAIHRSLARRRQRLQDQRESLRRAFRPESFDVGVDDLEELDDAPEGEVEEAEEKVLDRATAAATASELEEEVSTLRGLEEKAKSILHSGKDAKWAQLAQILEDEPLMTDTSGERRKLIIFTEAKDTLFYLADRIRTLRGRHEEVVVIHGGMGRAERLKAMEDFTHDPEVVFMVATDAAGEGINLQSAHLMVNYDLPWNPNRLEQRFGRIHRIGQTEVCHLWNLVASGTREGDVYLRLLQKLETEREALQGRVFDVVSRMFEERPLSELLMEAIRYGEQPQVRQRLYESVEAAVDRDHLQRLLDERALTSETMGLEAVERVREEMERAQARRLQPHFIRSFFLAAFEHLGGRAYRREGGRYEIAHVPAAIRERDRRRGVGTPVARRYWRVCFDKEDLEGLPPTAFICPGHPLLEATIDLILEHHRPLLSRGAVLVDDTDTGQEARVLFYLEHAVGDGRNSGEGSQQVVSRRLDFVELDAHGGERDPGPAPYLDYRPAREEELELLRGSGSGVELGGEQAQARAVDYATANLLPAHVRGVRERLEPQIEKVEAEVRARLSSQINYWDRRAQELAEAEREGRNTRLSSDNAAARAEELEQRLFRRLEELEAQRHLSALPPVVRGGALVVPGGMVAGVDDEVEEEPGADGGTDREEVERMAMEAVAAAERELGRVPRDVSGQRGIGYDIESKDPESGALYFIEVKGRWEGADEVSLTRNEVLVARNEGQRFRLAIVVVGESGPSEPRYLVGHDFGEPGFSQTTSTFSLGKLLGAAGEPL